MAFALRLDRVISRHPVQIVCIADIGTLLGQLIYVHFFAKMTENQTSLVTGSSGYAVAVSRMKTVRLING